MGEEAALVTPHSRAVRLVALSIIIFPWITRANVVTSEDDFWCEVLGHSEQFHKKTE